MDDFEYVAECVEPWIDKYINGGPSTLQHREAIGLGVWMLEAEVNNGGFHQYYSNSRGRLAEFTVHALLEIGAPDTASLLHAANLDIPAFPLPEDRSERFALLDQVAETARFSALETEFYQQREDRIALLAKYLQRTSGSDA